MLDETTLETLKTLHAGSVASVVEMAEALETARNDQDDDAEEAAREVIEQDALSVEVRGGWRIPGADGDGAEEYRILLTTGGPAVRIVGDLSQYGEPETAFLEVQDWGTQWTRFPVTSEAAAMLLTYAGCFYFGEG